MEKEKSLKDLYDLLFNQLEILTKINIHDEDFDKEKQRAMAVCETADRIIKNSELELRNQVWQATRRFKLMTRPTKLMIGSNEDYANEEY